MNWKRLKHRLKYLFRTREWSNDARQPRGRVAVFMTPLFGFVFSDNGYDPVYGSCRDSVRIGFLQHLWPAEGRELYLWSWEVYGIR